MFWGFAGSSSFNAEDEIVSLFCPMLDARRMEVYYAIYDSYGNKVKDIAAEVITEKSFINIPESQKIIFFGNGAAKCKEVINRENVFFVPDFNISAAHMQKPVYKAVQDLHYENVAYFEPLYLKDFITTKPKKNILGK
jgi:tRNA threonylcarbamoyladenosine biosynthesis protein TsaB